MLQVFLWNKIKSTSVKSEASKFRGSISIVKFKRNVIVILCISPNHILLSFFADIARKETHHLKDSDETR